RRVIPHYGTRSDALLTRSPLAARAQLPESRAAARLACVKHAASVQSEPGSNSSVRSLQVTHFDSSLPILLDEDQQHTAEMTMFAHATSTALASCEHQNIWNSRHKLSFTTSS